MIISARFLYRISIENKIGGSLKKELWPAHSNNGGWFLISDIVMYNCCQV
jgi:hypothetical protein